MDTPLKQMQSWYDMAPKAFVEAMSVLQPREVTVIKMKLGIDEPFKFTLDEIAKVFSCNQDRVRCILSKAYPKLLEQMKIILNRAA